MAGDRVPYRMLQALDYVAAVRNAPIPQYRHWTCGDRGVSDGTIRGTQVTGKKVEVRGCDLFEFTDGKISRQDSFWKIID